MNWRGVLGFDGNVDLIVRERRGRKRNGKQQREIRKKKEEERRERIRKRKWEIK